MPNWDPDRLDREAYLPPGMNLPVLFSDLDVNGHLNNVSAARHFEHARATAFAEMGFWRVASSDGGRSFVVHVGIDYLHEVRMNEVLHIRNRFVSVGRSSAAVEQAAWVGDRCVLLAEVVFAHALSGGSAPWPDAATRLLDELVAKSTALREGSRAG
jgi:YbgC/YbaW family acyl-CoA thioester hydrolase